MADIRSRAGSETWAILETALHDMLTSVDQGKLSQAAGPKRSPRVEGKVVVVPLYGMISQRASIWQMIFGGTSTDQLSAVMQALGDDSRVGAIVLDVDSPGGTISGVTQAADAVQEAAAKKPMVAISNSQMASAAYWIASQVGEGNLVAAPGSDTGSIGVFRLHEDLSGKLEQDGVSVTMIAEPPEKVESSPFAPLSPQAMGHHQGQVRASYNEFVQAVARGRGVRPETVRSAYGQGRVFHAKQAAEMRLVDRVGTLSEVLGGFGVSGDQLNNVSAASMRLERELCAIWRDGEPRAASASSLDRRRKRVEKKMRQGALA